MNDNQRALIQDWIEDTTILIYAHYRKAESYSRLHTVLGAISTCLSAIVGTAAFASIGSQQSMVAQTVVGITGLLAALISGVYASINLGQLAGRYQRSAAGYAAIRKHLEEIIITPNLTEEDLPKTLSSVRMKWDVLREESVPMSSRTLSKLAKRPNRADPVASKNPEL